MTTFTTPHKAIAPEVAEAIANVANVATRAALARAGAVLDRLEREAKMRRMRERLAAQVQTQTQTEQGGQPR